jgi:hypothetical protein
VNVTAVARCWSTLTKPTDRPSEPKAPERCYSLNYLPGQRLDFESPEALARAMMAIRAGTPVIVRDERDGAKQVLWAPGDEDRTSIQSALKFLGTPFRPLSWFVSRS